MARTELASLRITPCAMDNLLPIEQINLLQIDTQYVVERTRLTKTSSEHPQQPLTTPLQSAEVQVRLERLRHVMVPAFPVSPPVMDGEYIELTIFGQNAQLTLGWWTMAPADAWELADFAEWLRGAVGQGEKMELSSDTLGIPQFLRSKQ